VFIGERPPLCFEMKRVGGVYFEKVRRHRTGYIQSATYPTDVTFRENVGYSDYGWF
jgi:hypothetical protein